MESALSVQPDMDARTEHLITLVKDGATLSEAARVYGISGERVRQLLLEAGMRPSDLPGRAAKRREVPQSPPSPALAPVIELMWHGGMFLYEIAEVFDLSGEAVHRVISRRVSASELAARTSRLIDDRRSPGERKRDALRAAARALGEVTEIDAADRHQAGAAINHWLAAQTERGAIDLRT